MNGEIFVWESATGWKIVEAWRDSHGCPYSCYTILDDGMLWADAVAAAQRLRKTFGLA